MQLRRHEGRAPMIVRRATGLAFLIFGLAVLLLAIAGCGSEDPTPTATAAPTATAVPAATAAPTATPTPSKAAWEIEWDALVAAAQEEGQLEFDGYNLSFTPIFDRFEEIFGIKINSRLGSSGSSIADRLLAERGAGRYDLDGFRVGLTTTTSRLIPNNVLTPIKPLLILPDVVDESLWLHGKHKYGDKDQLYAFTIQIQAGLFDMQARYNTDLISQEEYDSINSWWDIIGPEWEGRIITLHPEARQATWTGEASFHPDLGLEWLQAFWSNGITVMPNTNVGTDWIAQGAYALCVPCTGTASDLDLLAELGLPIGDFEDKQEPGKWKDRLALHASGGGSNYVLAIDKVPHPNARKVFLNWYLSKEGQTAKHLLFKDGNPTTREDVTERGVTDPLYWREPEKEYLDLHAEPGYTYEGAKERTIEYFEKYYVPPGG